MPRDAGDDAYEELAKEQRAAKVAYVTKRRDQVQARLKERMKKQKHAVKRAEIGGHSDQFECSCGWKSNAYWDLEEAAWGEWLLHAYDTKTTIRPTFRAHQTRLVKERDQQLQRLRAQRAHIDKQIAALEPKRKRS